MTIVTITPVALLSGGGSNWVTDTNSSNAAALATAINDGNNSTYIVNAVNSTYIQFSLSTTTLTVDTDGVALLRCSRARPNVKVATTNANTILPAYQIGNHLIGNHFEPNPGGATGITSIPTLYQGAWANTYNGQEWTQSNVDNMDIQLGEYVSSVGSGVNVIGVSADLDIHTRPSQVITALGTITSTHTPTLNWTNTLNDGATLQSAYSVFLYDKSINPSPFLPVRQFSSWDLNGLVSHSDQPHPQTSHILPALPNGNYRAYVSVAKGFQGVSDYWWSKATYIDFTVAVTPGGATGVAIVGGSPSNTNSPQLTAVVAGPAPNVAGSTSAANRVRAEFRTARDSAFTTSLSAFASASWSTVSASSNYQLLLTESLGIGTWYLSARTGDSYGAVGAWSAAVSFTIAHQPAANVEAPVGGTAISFDGSVGEAFNWTFYSTSPDVTQTAYQILIEDNQSGAQVFDTGKVASTLQSGNVVIPVVNKDQVLQWRVRVWDVDDVVSVYSGYGIFQTSDAPTIVITVTPNPATSPQPDFSWSVSGSNSRSQVAYRYILYTSTGVALEDSGRIQSTVINGYTAGVGILQNLSSYLLAVLVWDNYNLTSYSVVAFTTSWTVPASPVFAADASSLDSAGFVSVTWDNASLDVAFHSWRVYRRESSTSIWELLVEDVDAGPTHQYRDYLVKANIDYDYLVVQVVTEFGAYVESAYTYATVTTNANHYWLIAPTNYGLSYKLPLVKDEGFTDEYETTTFPLAGRGRKVDFGYRIGIMGSLTAQLRDDEISGISAREMRLAIQAAKAERTSMYIRNPFGDLWKVAITDVAFKRVPGSGLSEFVDITLPYTEVS